MASFQSLNGTDAALPGNLLIGQLYVANDTGKLYVGKGGGPTLQLGPAGTGDVTWAGNGSFVTTIAALAVTTGKIAANAVTYAKMQSMTTVTLLGNPTGGGAVPSEITLGAALAFSGQALQTVAHTGDVTSPANSLVMTIAANAVTQAKLAANAKTARASVASDVTTTSSTQANVTGLSFAIAANEVWTAEFALVCTGTGTGMAFQLTGPSSPTNVLIFTQGSTISASVFSGDGQAAFSTPTQAYVAGAFNGVVVMRATIENGANAGTVALQFAAATNTQTEKVLRGSYMVANRVS